VLFAAVFWVVLWDSRMNGFAKILYILFLPLTGTPYILWLVDTEGQQPEEYLKDQYGSAGWMWFARVYLMVAVSALSSVAAILILGAFAVVFGLLK
jgi:hypothetical protein